MMDSGSRALAVTSDRIKKGRLAIGISLRLAQMLQEASILVIYEIMIQYKKVVEAIDIVLQDIGSSTDIMSGLFFLRCDEFRQTLPVVQHGMRVNVVDACLKSSQLWSAVNFYELKKNMRLLLDASKNLEAFA
ncbi:ATP-dependent DNA helicase pif7-like protein [Plakobranchus ocellatus]|uniref:ATP-dependent DNA helicase n=1 Tax=Plakobranchus ocellatus TaxID=259542 RepID=A0AAV4DAL9_9GAST|nr:ATP-dependent DNA helicase pif7-like protein [Plakobranchus ocellatus]